MIVTLKTNEPVAEIGLYDHNGQRLASETWQAHRELSSSVLVRLTGLLQTLGKEIGDISSAVFYEGPGSFTGLRIGAAMLNALEVPVVNSSGENWIEEGLLAVSAATGGTATPNYGREPHITRPRK